MVAQERQGKALTQHVVGKLTALASGDLASQALAIGEVGIGYGQPAKRPLQGRVAQSPDGRNLPGHVAQPAESGRMIAGRHRDVF